MDGDNEDNKGIEVLGEPDTPAPAPQRVTSQDMASALLADSSSSSALGTVRSHLRQDAVARAVEVYKDLLASTSDKVALQAAEKIMNLAFGEDEVKGKKESAGGGIHFHLGGSGSNEDASTQDVTPPPSGEVISIDERERYEK